jgi:hypothetical protein
MTKHHIAAIGLIVIGLAQMTADLAGLRTLKSLAAATGASPAPKVFSSTRGLETFSSQFLLHWIDHEGNAQSMTMTPEIYARLRGPYNRRNVYGAMLAYGPVLAADARTRPLLNDMLRYTMTGDAPLMRELGLDPRQMQSVKVQVIPRGGIPDPELPLELAP